SLVEGQRRNHRWDGFAAYLDGDAGARRRLAAAGDIAHANWLAQRGSHAAAGERANRLALLGDRIFGARHPALGQFDAYQLAAQALRLLSYQRVAANEIYAFVQLDGPAESSFQWGDLLGQLVAIEAIARLQPQRVARAQPRGQQALRFACVEQG